MSESLIRNLINKAARHPEIETAVMGAIRDTLPNVIERLLREDFAGETLRIYVAKRGRQDKKTRDGKIRLTFDGTNGAALAKESNLSVKQIRRIARSEK